MHTAQASATIRCMHVQTCTRTRMCMSTCLCPHPARIARLTQEDSPAEQSVNISTACLNHHEHAIAMQFPKLMSTNALLECVLLPCLQLYQICLS